MVTGNKPQVNHACSWRRVRTAFFGHFRDEVAAAIVTGMQVMHQAICDGLQGKVAPALLEEIRELPLPELPTYAK